MLTPLSALDAFRRDISSHPEGAATGDARWLQVVTLLQTAVDVAAAHRGDILDAAAALADADARTPGGELLPLAVSLVHPAPPVLELPLRAAIAMEDAARFQLAYAAYDALLRVAVAAVPDPAQRAELQGLLLALQGRVARQLGDAAAAKERYEAAEEIGRRFRNPAVMARAWVGYGRLAHTRGNIPEARRWFVQVLGESQAARESHQVAHQSLMVIAASGGNYAAAAEHGWAAYELAGDHEDAAAALCDLSELMRVSGRPGLALRGFAAALLRVPSAPRRSMPALGGAALAAAEALAPDVASPLVAGYRDRIERLIATTNLPLSHAQALADLGDAYAVLGRAAEAAEVRQRAAAIAQGYGFFEVLYRVTEGARTVSPRRDLAPVRPAKVASDEPVDGMRPVLDAIAAFETSPEVEAALATASA